MTQKEKAISFLSLASSNRVNEGFEQYIHGKATLGKQIFGVIHLFRFYEDKIIESWEASQVEIEDSVNAYGLF